MKTVKKNYAGMTMDQLDETIASQQTLKDKVKPQPSNDDVARALEIMMGLNAASRQRHVDFLTASLKAHDEGDGVPDSYAAKNRASLKGGSAENKTKNPTVAQSLQQREQQREELEEALKAAFPDLTPDMQEKFAEIFEDRVRAVKFSQVMQELFEECPWYELVFATDEEIDAVEYLAAQICEKEELLEQLELEKAFLLRKTQALSEEALIYVTPKKRHSSHNLADDFAPNEDNRVLMETDVQHQREKSTLDPRKEARYLEVLERTTKHVDAHPLNENILAAWKNN